MEFLQQIWHAILYVKESAAQHPGTSSIISILTAGGLFYAWCLDVRLKRRQVREAKREDAKRNEEEAIHDLYIKIRDAERKLQKAARSSITLMDPQPEPGEDPRLLAIAWERYKDDKAARMQANSRWVR
jgi:hypothetical protein